MYIVTGGAGFIGSNIAAALDAEDREILIVDRLGRGDKWKNIAKRRVHDVIPPEALFDHVTDKAGMVEGVFHMGAISATTEADADALVKNNLRMSIDLWRWCAESGKRFVYASSAATYGDGAAGFLDRQDEGYLSGLRPLNAYGWSKHAFDRWAVREAALGRRAPPRWAGLKFFNVYGPNEHHKGAQRSVINRFFDQIRETGRVELFESGRPDCAHGDQTRDFIWVGDCVDVALWAMFGDAVPNGLYNAGSGLPRTFADAARTVFQTMDKPESIGFVPLPEALKNTYQYYTEADRTKLRDAGFPGKPTPLEDGIRRYIGDHLAAADPYR